MTEDKQLMFKAEMLNHQLEQLEQQLGQLDRQAAEIASLKEAVDRFAGMQQGDEVLAPLATGIFAKTAFSGEQRLFVNVGSGAVVPKSVQDVHRMLDEQAANLRQYQEQLHKEFERLLTELQRMQQEFEG